MDLINTFLWENRYNFYSIKDIKNYILKHYSENWVIFTRKIIIEKWWWAFLVWISRNKKLKELKINRFYKLLEKLGLKTNKKTKSSNIKKKIKFPVLIEKKLLKTQIELNKNKLLYIEWDKNIVKEENTYISLFSWWGWWSIWLKQWWYKNLLWIDIDKKQSLLYQHNIGNALNYDITKIDFNKLKKVFWKPKLLLLSPPCQFFSLSNYKNNNLENKELDQKNIKIFNSIYESIKIFDSEFIIFENVPNITTFDFFNDFIKNIENIWYKSKIYTLKVSDFWGLTIRKRCIVIFSKEDIFNQIDKEIITYKKSNFIEWSWNTLKWVRNSNKYCFENKKSIKDTNRIKEIIDLMKIKENYKTPNKEVIKILKETKWYNIYNSEFYFVSKNIKLMPTLLARPHMIHPSWKRYLTIQELKKIQWYSYNYDFLDLSHRDSAYSIWESISPILTKILWKILIKMR
jgi:site-specific DNA-cytosine methylase